MLTYELIESEIGFIDGLGWARNGRPEKHVELLKIYIAVNKDREEWGWFVKHAQARLKRIFENKKHPTPREVAKKIWDMYRRANLIRSYEERQKEKGRG